MTHVLGLDLSKVGLGQALEAMAEAWLDAQGVGDGDSPPLLSAEMLLRETPINLRQSILRNLTNLGKENPDRWVSMPDLWRALGFEWLPKRTAATRPAMHLRSVLEGLKMDGVIEISYGFGRRYRVTA